jgi:hypothetical protein
MKLSEADVGWPTVTLTLGLLALGVLVLIVVVGSALELRKARLRARQDDDLRQLVRRYEQLAENTVDAQVRVATDVAELRARATSIEQILRTVE